MLGRAPPLAGLAALRTHRGPRYHRQGQLQAPSPSAYLSLGKICPAAIYSLFTYTPLSKRRFCSTIVPEADRDQP